MKTLILLSIALFLLVLGLFSAFFLFLVLSNFFMTTTESGKNIADVLEDISKSLKEIQTQKNGGKWFK